MLEQRRHVLTEALSDPDVGVRKAASEALEALEPALHINMLLQGLKSPKRAERIRCLYALETVRSPRVLPSWLNCLTDADADVRATAVQVIGARGESRALPELAKRLRDEVAAVRMYAAEALGRFRDARLVPHLASVLRDEDSGVVTAAVCSLGKIGSAAAEKYLLAILRDRRPAVRAEAARALALLEWEDSPVKV
ncbi:MAG TPA: HEAT repeat domain-containing protein [Geoalkalibacter subterraneus]|uniref:HEAT repeat domain-containing protein n=1 Tax=Geoalkalibacter subterraneus TaxID=483547 RepID=A0A831PJR6_9BACT|nr:HEAT repeat domain-containing protein [Geoalkalibacter subterraneus]